MLGGGGREAEIHTDLLVPGWALCFGYCQVNGQRYHPLNLFNSFIIMFDRLESTHNGQPGCLFLYSLRIRLTLG